MSSLQASCYQQSFCCNKLLFYTPSDSVHETCCKYIQDPKALIAQDRGSAAVPLVPVYLGPELQERKKHHLSYTPIHKLFCKGNLSSQRRV